MAIYAVLYEAIIVSVLSSGAFAGTCYKLFISLSRSQIYVHMCGSDLSLCQHRYDLSSRLGNTPTNCLVNVCDESAIATFDWDELMESGTDKPQVVDFNMDVNETDLSLNILVKLTYEGASSADVYGQVYGTTYVLDFEDFNAHSDAINEPGTCQNRNADDFTGAFSTFWAYSTNPADESSIGSSEYLAYPPPDAVSGSWSISMSEEDECGVLVYEGKFTWNELVACTAFGGGDSYISTTDGDTAITLEGTFYVNVVSPYSQNTAADSGYYRVYQLLSQPFIITINKNVYVLNYAEINLLTLSIIAVYKEDAESVFKLVMLTEAQEYLQLTRSDQSLVTYSPSYTSANGNKDIVVTDFTVALTAETSDASPNDGCLNNKDYICSQLWVIEADGACGDGDSFIDFSGAYTLKFVPECRSSVDIDSALAAYCENWLNVEHAELTDGVDLTANLVWRDEECDPQLFEVQFVAAMDFYVDGWTTAAADNELYQVGEDTIYAKITTSFPTDTYNVFDTTLLNVWICTFDPLTPPSLDIDPGTADGGCFDISKDDLAFYHIYDAQSDPTVEEEGFALFGTTGHPDDSDESKNQLLFSFVVPSKVARDKLYVHAQVEVSLTSARRRRLLGIMATANQMDHFLGDVGVSTESKPKQNPMDNNDNNNYDKPVFNEPPPQQPQPPQPVNDYVLSLQSSWIMAIGGLLAVVLTLNIVFMCYMNCCRSSGGFGGGRVSFSRARRSGYDSVKANESEADAINVACE